MLCNYYYTFSAVYTWIVYEQGWWHHFLSPVRGVVLLTASTKQVPTLLNNLVDFAQKLNFVFPTGFLIFLPCNHKVSLVPVQQHGWFDMFLIWYDKAHDWWVGRRDGMCHTAIILGIIDLAIVDSVSGLSPTDIITAIISQAWRLFVLF